MKGAERSILMVLVVLCVRAHGQDAARLIAQGDSLLAAERPQKALEKFNAAVQLAPTATSYSARARAWSYMDRMDRYLMDVDKALKLDSLHIEANYQRAVYALRGEDRSLAERLATRALDHGAQDPLRRQLLVLRGEARAELKKDLPAINDLQQGLGDRTDDLPALKILARLYDATGEHALSLATLEKLCTLEPGDIGNWTNRGYELTELGRYDEALDIYAKALQLDKDEPTALSNRAYTLLKLGRDAEALTDVERSLRAYPANPFALRTRALLRLRKGDREKACDDLSLAKILGEVPDVDALIKEHCNGGTPKH